MDKDRATLSPYEQRRQEYTAIQRIAETLDGQLLLAWLKRRVRYGRAIVVPGDPCLTHFALGRQDPINELVSIIETPVEELLRSSSPDRQKTSAASDPMWDRGMIDDQY